jgi:hypothetical protein
MTDEELDPEGEVPEGVAVFPTIPAELGVHPLLLATIHAVVLLAGSDESVVEGAVADEAVEQMAEYLQRLDGADLRRVQEDMACLTAFARQQRWPRGLIQSLKSFLSDLGVDPEGEQDV